MNHSKLVAGSKAPSMSFNKLGGGQITLGQPGNGVDWQMLVIYRGKHCPKCTDYLKELKKLHKGFLEAGVDVAVLSADTKDKATAHAQQELEVPFDIGYDLSIKQMQQLGLYISSPRSAKETDRPFAEPAIFVVNADAKLHIIDLSNAPFARPELNTLLGGIEFIRKNDYPIRGTYDAES